ncbi:MAG: hypothetical protein KAI24_04615 [Planctomycetes bacterium]|nr:hypothetical protein [Planctomycetota bacterium]
MITGCGLSQVTEVSFGAIALSTSAPFGDGSYKIVSDDRLEVCPPLCLDAGSYDITYSDANGVIGQKTVFLEDPTTPTLVCESEHTVGTTQCTFIHTGPVTDVLIFTIISSSPQPTVVPGLLSLELGNQGQEYLCGPPLVGNCVKDTIGVIPVSGLGQRLYFQALLVNPFTMAMPFGNTNRCHTDYVN